MSKEYFTVSFLRRLNKTVLAESADEALELAGWHHIAVPVDGDVLLGVVKGDRPVTGGHDGSGPPLGAPPTGPSPGTPVLDHLLAERAA